MNFLIIQKSKNMLYVFFTNSAMPKCFTQILLLNKSDNLIKFASEEYLSLSNSPEHLKTIAHSLFFFLKSFPPIEVIINVFTLLAFLVTLSGRNLPLNVLIPFCSIFFDSIRLSVGSSIGISIQKILIKQHFSRERTILLMISIIKFKPNLKISKQLVNELKEIISLADSYVHSLLNHVLFVISQEYPILVESKIDKLPFRFVAPILSGLNSFTPCTLR